MRVAILETGAPSAALAERFGDYPSMFERLLELGPLPSFQVNQGAWPKSVGDYDAYVVTGSPAGVYDPLPWIAELKSFLRAAKGQAALVGVCFGHQVMAEAFGGHVIKSPKGWGLGLQHYQVIDPQPWMDHAPGFSIPASHQDQVILHPPEAKVIAANPLTHFAALAYHDQPAISFQGHPEFEVDFAQALLKSRKGSVLPHDQTEAAIASLDRPNDRARVGGWIRAFLRGVSSKALDH
jgi:GMP synthase-like glutamine amidotransferase